MRGSATCASRPSFRPEPRCGRRRETNAAPARFPRPARISPRGCVTLPAFFRELTMRTYRGMIAAALLMLCAAPAFADALQAKLDALAQRAQPAHLGVTVIDLHSGQTWRVGAGRAYPMMSVFKAPLGAALLARVDRGELSLDRSVTITRADLRQGVSPIAKHFQGESMTFTVRQLLKAAVGDSDNTAADALLPLVGGPAGLTAWLRTQGIQGMRVDRGEGGISHDVMGLDAHDQPPPGETDAKATPASAAAFWLTCAGRATPAHRTRRPAFCASCGRASCCRRAPPACCWT